MTAEATGVRIEVMALRMRLEHASNVAVNRACHRNNPMDSRNVAAGLLFVLDSAAEGQWLSTYHNVKLGGYVYRRTSDVLHGRTSAFNVTAVVLDEWKTVVDALEEIVALKAG